MNEPRCESMSRPDGGQCRNQAAGHWPIQGTKRVIPLCDDCRLSLDEQGKGRTIVEPWEPLHPDPVQSAIARRLELMRQGAFG